MAIVVHLNDGGLVTFGAPPWPLLTAVHMLYSNYHCERPLRSSRLRRRRDVCR
jgi:hypothetical protein